MAGVIITIITVFSSVRVTFTITSSNGGGDPRGEIVTVIPNGVGSLRGIMVVLSPV